MSKQKTHLQLVSELSELFISWRQRCMDPMFPPDEEEKADHRAHVAEYRRSIARAKPWQPATSPAGVKHYRREGP